MGGFDPTGVNPRLVENVRGALDEAGFDGVKIVVSGGFTAERIRAFEAGGVPVDGLCLYPVLDYPGWADDRLCATGLYGMPDADGARALHEPLAAQLCFERRRFASVSR